MTFTGVFCFRPTLLLSIRKRTLVFEMKQPVVYFESQTNTDVIDVIFVRKSFSETERDFLVGL